MRTYAFIDASNLFYGFDKEYGWKIDYARLKRYLETKYGASEAFYFGGIDTAIGLHPNKEFFHDYSGDESVNLDRYVAHFENVLRTNTELSEVQIVLAKRFIQRARFYKRLETFGYKLFLKPVKRIERGEFAMPRRKANCDVDLTLAALTASERYDRAIVLSGDGDFLPLYKYLESKGKQVYVLARAKRTAREVKRHLGTKFLEIRKLQKQIEWIEEK